MHPRLGLTAAVLAARLAGQAIGALVRPAGRSVTLRGPIAGLAGRGRCRARAENRTAHPHQRRAQPIAVSKSADMPIDRPHSPCSAAQDAR